MPREFLTPEGHRGLCLNTDVWSVDTSILYCPVCNQFIDLRDIKIDKDNLKKKKDKWQQL